MDCPRHGVVSNGVMSRTGVSFLCILLVLGLVAATAASCGNSGGGGSPSASNSLGQAAIRLIAIPDPVLKGSPHGAGQATVIDLFGTTPAGVKVALPASAYTLEESLDGVRFNDTGLGATLFSDGFFFQVTNGGNDAFYRVIAEEAPDKKHVSQTLRAAVEDSVDQDVTILEPVDGSTGVTREVEALWDRDAQASTYAVFIANSPSGSIEWLVEVTTTTWQTPDAVKSLIEEGDDPLLANRPYLILVVGLDSNGWATSGSTVNRFTTGP